MVKLLQALRILGLALFLLSPATSLGAIDSTSFQPPSGVFFPETFTLKNGLKVVVVTNRRVPLVTQMVWYKVGATEEPAGQSGIAHLLEHVMFKGTKTMGPGEFSRTIARNGGKDNAFTSWDYTAYFETIAKDRLELVIKMEADRMANLRLADELVAPEVKVVLEERRQRTENQPAARLSEEMQTALFVHHPYGIPIIGWEGEIKNLNRSQAEAFYKTWYVPNNATVIFAGDVDAAEVRPLVEKYYGAVPTRPVPARPAFPAPVGDGEQRITLRDPSVSVPQWQRMYLAPSSQKDPEKLSDALQVFAEALGGGTTSRLYRHLVVEKKLAVGAGADYSLSNRDLATFVLSALPAPGVTPEKLEQAVMKEIEEALAKGLTAEELNSAKIRLQRSAIFARDSASAPAWMLGAALAIGESIDDVETWPQRIAVVTPEQVAKAAQSVLRTHRHVTGILLPGPREAS